LKVTFASGVPEPVHFMREKDPETAHTKLSAVTCFLAPLSAATLSAATGSVWAPEIMRVRGMETSHSTLSS